MLMEYKKELPTKLRLFEKIIGDKNWFAGDKVMKMPFKIFNSKFLRY